MPKTAKHAGTNTPSSDTHRTKKAYDLMLPTSFLIKSTLITTSVSFLLGCFFYIIVQEQHFQYSKPSATVDSFSPPSDGSFDLPFPMLIPGKKKPDTKYTFREFTVSTVRTSHTMHIQQMNQTLDTQERHVTFENTAADFHQDDLEVHEPAGQHLLVDIKNVDFGFLDSEERLAQAMVDVVRESQLTLLSYHCHSLIPMGVSCVGVLLESHVSFHTWPDEGVITLDLYTCGPDSLLPVIPLVEKLFAIPRECDNCEEERDPPKVIWSHKLRGFRSPKSGGSSFDNDLTEYVLDPMLFEYKKEIVSVTTEYQKIDIYDVVNLKYGSPQKFEGNDDDADKYQGNKPNRMLFIDGIIKSTSIGDAPYHEALVHPGMLTAVDPSMVGIIGGGDGAILREVLKHNTLTQAILFEEDEQMIQLSRNYLSEWNDCSHLLNSTQSCFDDPVVTIVHESPLYWFTERYKYPCDGDDMNPDEIIYCDDEVEDPKNIIADEEDLFDAIILDILDENFYLEKSPEEGRLFFEAIYGALDERGVMIMSLGESPKLRSPPESFTKHKYRAMLLSLIEELGFESLHIYEESHGNFQVLSSFLVACKHFDCRHEWYQNPAQWQNSIIDRMELTPSGRVPLYHLDGSTMSSYQIPPKVWETVTCRSDDAPLECKTLLGFDPQMVNIPGEDFEVKQSKIGEKANRGLFTKVDIPKGALIMQDQAIHNVHFTHINIFRAENMYEMNPILKEYFQELKQVLGYVYGYGFQQSVIANYEYYVDSYKLAFVNHGCNGTSNVKMFHGENAESADDPYFSEQTLNLDIHPFREPMNIQRTYCIVLDRHYPQFVTMDVANRDVRAGEEILSNYLNYCAHAVDWEKHTRKLKETCSGLNEDIESEI